MGLVGTSLAAMSYAVALTLESEDALAPLLNGIALPVLLLSGVALPMSVAPSWLETLSDFQPVQAHRRRRTRGLPRRHDLVGRPGVGLAVTVALVALGIIVGTRTFRRESA